MTDIFEVYVGTYYTPQILQTKSWKMISIFYIGVAQWYHLNIQYHTLHQLTWHQLHLTRNAGIVLQSIIIFKIPWRIPLSTFQINTSIGFCILIIRSPIQISQTWPAALSQRFPRHRLLRKSLVSDPSMHHGPCVKHVPWCMSRSLTRDGGENVPDISGACATRNFTYLVRGPLLYVIHKEMVRFLIQFLIASFSQYELNVILSYKN